MSKSKVKAVCKECEGNVNGWCSEYETNKWEEKFNRCIAFDVTQSVKKESSIHKQHNEKFKISDEETWSIRECPVCENEISYKIKNLNIKTGLSNIIVRMCDDCLLELSDYIRGCVGINNIIKRR
ncbi:MAG: hypothetical protein ACRDDY_07925 [Clostridium sp.]|uniref:hypothetical protein n=1 Tax=Clostridium sp. TaxID=1506 RepID=UPI003EE5EA28